MTTQRTQTNSFPLYRHILYNMYALMPSVWQTDLHIYNKINNVSQFGTVHTRADLFAATRHVTCTILLYCCLFAACCHQLRYNKTQRFDVFVIRFYSLSFVAFIHYKRYRIRFQSTPAMRMHFSSIRNEYMRNFYISLLFFFFTRFYIALIRFFYFFLLILLSFTCFRCVAVSMLLCNVTRALLVQHVFRFRHRMQELSNSSTVCQLPNETELELIA